LYLLPVGDIRLNRERVGSAEFLGLGHSLPGLLLIESAMTGFTRSRANARLMPRPIFEPPPVTIALFPAGPNSG
jgi:hypothetical protein